MQAKYASTDPQKLKIETAVTRVGNLRGVHANRNAYLAALEKNIPTFTCNHFYSYYFLIARLQRLVYPYFSYFYEEKNCVLI